MAMGLKEMVAAARSHVRDVASAEVKKDLDSGDVLVVDVREPGEFGEGHVPGAVNVPRGLLELKADPDSPVTDPVLSAKREARVVVYCTKAPSARSVLAAETLGKMGYTDVAALEGGLNAWREAGYAVEGS